MDIVVAGEVLNVEFSLGWVASLYGLISAVNFL
ncbi:hypothetical protein P872_07660 [Rhodonellum psychrophilum GCM71 = DSM 17998]|uniref:Uncharacterized protein n=2 Tax=Rhodonellum TaxID=336827 RepID=U5BV88_9BACT|nr:hypothetical protein P872_07660 [Rhodonellum psychrophilum GCM71 = DSM 17998]SDZ28326.1 hypothetical protein SAMN05444412_10967 [Rhodonellum ikkaensis]